MDLNEDDKQKIREALPKVHNLVARNLIRAITEGKIPTDRQLEMLKSAVAMPDPADTSTASDFQLDATVPDDHQGAADFYGVNRKTLQRWKTAGQTANDPCPFKAPGQMLEWWTRVFKKPIPECLHEAIAKCAPGPAAAPPATEGTRLPSMDLSRFNPADYNFDTMLMSMATLMLAQRELLTKALESGEERRITQATEKFQETVEAMRRLEKDSGKIQEQQGLTYRSADVRAAIIEAHQFIPARFKTVLKLMIRALPGLSMSDREMDEWAERVVDDACAALVKTDLLNSRAA